MHYVAAPNLVLESLIYLGLRASGTDPELLEKRLVKMGCTDLAPFRSRYAPFRQLLDRLGEIPLPEDTLAELFTDLSGFPRSTAGGYSLALLLFLTAASQHDGDLDSFLAAMARRTDEEVSRDFLISLELGQQITPGASCSALLRQMLPELPLTRRSRKAFLDAMRGYDEILDRTAQCLRPVYAALREMSPTLNEIARSGSGELSGPEMERYLRENSVFQLDTDTEYTIHPLLVDPCSGLFFDMLPDQDGPIIYCGLMHQFMRHQQKMAAASRSHIHECLHLLGDATRFEIFCYLRDHPAYGQELSEHFGLARNTIHHHMTRLFDVGLVHCVVRGARVYYSIDEAHFGYLLEHLRALFIPHGKMP